MDHPVLFGRYRLIERAGSGGSAEVWRAIDERSGEEVALKRLHPVVFGSEAGRRRLVREFRALRGLRHPNVVGVRDLEIGTDEAAIVLDYVRGPSLRERLAADGRLPPDAAVRIASQVASALAAAHEAGIVHRDVSPGNILLDAGGNARLTDFGIADDAADETAVTATGTLVGTLRYVAPEQLRGEPATPASDLFGLAAVTYEMLAGRPVYEAMTPVGLVEAQRRGAPPIEHLDPHLDAAVRAGLAPDPRDRPPSVGAFASALSPGHDDDTIAVPLSPPGQPADVAPSAAPRPTARTRAATGPVALAGALVLGALVLVAALAGGNRGATTGADPATPPPTPAVEVTEPPAEERPADDDKKGDGDGESDDKGKSDDGKGKGKDGD
jgi:serine/threonine-protein kinase